jgi:hypothetical protein
VRAAYEVGLTPEELSQMSARQVVWRINGKREAVMVRDRNDWARTRRLYFALARTMGGFKGDEDGLWYIEGVDREPLTKEGFEVKRQRWEERLKELDKWQRRKN